MVFYFTYADRFSLENCWFTGYKLGSRWYQILPFCCHSYFEDSVPCSSVPCSRYIFLAIVCKRNRKYIEYNRAMQVHR